MVRGMVMKEQPLLLEVSLNASTFLCHPSPLKPSAMSQNHQWRPKHLPTGSYTPLHFQKFKGVLLHILGLRLHQVYWDHVLPDESS